MADAIRAVDEAFEARPQVDPDTLPLPDHVVRFPSCHNIAKLIELLDRVVPMPHAVLMAHLLLDRSQRAGMDFVDWYEDRSPLRPLEGDHGHWVIQPKLGFAEIEHFTQPSVRTGVDRRTYSAESYYHIVARTLSNAHLLLEFVLSAVPPSLIEPIPEHLRDAGTAHNMENPSTGAADVTEPGQ